MGRKKRKTGLEIKKGKRHHKQWQFLVSILDFCSLWYYVTSNAMFLSPSVFTGRLCFFQENPATWAPSDVSNCRSLVVTRSRWTCGTAFYTGFHPIFGSLFEVTFQKTHDTGWCIGILHCLVTIPINNSASIIPIITANSEGLVTAHLIIAFIFTQIWPKKWGPVKRRCICLWLAWNGKNVLKNPSKLRSTL